MRSQRVQRQNYLDWLRVLGVLAVIVYHTTRLFNPGDWLVKNATVYEWLDIWNSFAITWLMPLFFIVSGISLFYAAGKSSAAKFIRDKVLRLLVPLLVGMFTHCALQVYWERMAHGDFSGTFFRFIPYYFQGHYEGGNPSAGNFAATGIHLWYLAWLFAFTLLLYPLMRWLLGRGKGVLAWLGNALSQPGAVLLLALPVLLFALDREGDPFLLWWEAGWPLLVYLWLILAGFLLASSQRVLDRVQRMRWIYLALAVVILAATAISAYPGGEVALGSARHALHWCLRSLSSWCWVLAFVGLAREYLTRRTPFLQYANEAVLPFYILHQTVIVGVGYFVVQWTIPGLLKWAIVLALSLAIIMVLYEFLIRRFNGMRVLFGLKWQPKAPAAQQKPAMRGSG
jgi:peptidoglycan/LPS O-acetylase OafA/YrhL